MLSKNAVKFILRSKYYYLLTDLEHLRNLFEIIGKIQIILAVKRSELGYLKAIKHIFLSVDFCVHFS